MPQSEQFEILILGSGFGGKLLAWHLAKSGRRTAVVERRWIGGSCSGANRSTRGRLVPYCMFTEPPLAHVGLSEREAQQRSVTVRVARLPMSGVRRTATTDETLGFMKVLVGASDDRILGFTMIGAEAGEVMAVVQTAMLADLPYPKLRDAILAHPTMSEGLGDLFANVPPRSGP
jgi:pyruvate/2-oxoglutarate dehydrogenase complex dihydrolipoamide dehydrogenase (E3) component